MPPSSRPTAFALVSATVLVSATRIRLVSATVPPSLLASLRDAFRLRNPRDSSSLPPCDSMRLCAYALSAHLPLVPQKSFPSATTKVRCHIATIKLLFTSTEPFAPQAVAAARACTCARAVLAPISTSAPRTHALASSQSIQHRSMQGPQYAILVHLAMMLSTVHGWVLPSDDKAHDSYLILSHLIPLVARVGDDHGRSRRRKRSTGSSSTTLVITNISRPRGSVSPCRVSCDVVKISELRVDPSPAFGTSDHAQPSNERHDQDGPAPGLGAA